MADQARIVTFSIAAPVAAALAIVAPNYKASALPSFVWTDAVLAQAAHVTTSSIGRVNAPSPLVKTFADDHGKLEMEGRDHTGALPRGFALLAISSVVAFAATLACAALSFVPRSGSEIGTTGLLTLTVAGITAYFAARLAKAG